MKEERKEVYRKGRRRDKGAQRMRDVKRKGWVI